MLEKNINLNGKTVLVTGATGFIGCNLVLELFRSFSDVRVVGIDNMNDYYDVSIKEYRLKEIEKFTEENSKEWIFVKGNIADKPLIDKIFEDYAPSVVVNLAAQAGVRYSITNPDVYIESNLIGFYNILEACRHSYDGGKVGVEHLVYASSSSVYGSNKKVPYSTDDKVDNPVSLYAATKKSNELLAHAYSKLYNIPSTGLRFFTVYGPAGRPDMAYFGFTNKLIKGEKIQIFNYGNCKRDFTFVDDIVEGVKRVMQVAPEKKTGEDGLPLPPYRVYNIGNNSPENLLDFVDILQQELVQAKVLPEDYDFNAHKELVPMQAGDVPVTFADTSDLEKDFGFKPSTSLREGLKKFAKWYKEFYLSK
ncbi:MAG: GDP-mannose 4,6-dehydratase [Clostridia bacterium]|nr:GDP-mannose 4,6-dehydratase [Clostridia bacterium]